MLLPGLLFAAFIAAAAPHATDTLRSNTVTSILFASDGTLYGTAHGLYAVRDSGPGSAGMIGGFDKSVTCLSAAPGGRILVGTATGAYLFRDGRVQAIPALPTWPDAMIMAAASSESRSFIGGSFGLAEARFHGDTAALEPVAPPAGPATVSALAARGPDLLVAFDKDLYLYRSLRQEWSKVSEGTSYTSLLFLPAQKWIGLRMDGGIDAGDIANPRNFTSLELPVSYDPVSAIGCAERPGAEPYFIAGTSQGRVLGGLVMAGDVPKIELSALRVPGEVSFPIRAIASPDGRMVVAGLDQGGILQLALNEDATYIETTTVSTEERVVPVTAAAPEKPAESPRASWRQTFERLRRSTALRAVLVGGAALAALAFLIWRLLAMHARSEVRVKERRREPSRRPDLPKMVELSPELAERARAMKKVTDEINELSLEAARGHAGEITGKMSEVRAEFDAIDAWMRERLAAVRAERASKLERLTALRRADAPHDAQVEEELAGIERWLVGANADELYLKYVLEE